MADEQVRPMKAIVKDLQHCKRLALTLQSFTDHNDFTDVCFICAHGMKLYAHKLVLCSVSTGLKQIFTELPDNLETITIHLPDVELRTMGLVIEFLYEGAVRVNKNEYTAFQEVMSMLNIVLTTPSGESVATTSQTTVAFPTQPVQSPQQAQAPQMVYVPVTPNNQGGQVQYILATQQPIGQGQVIQNSMMSPVVQQGNMIQQPSSQPMFMGQSGAMVQSGTQVIQQPQMQQPQMQQPQVQQSQMQQANVVQMVQQNNAQVVPINNQMVTGNHIVNGNQMMQCSSQMVGQSNQQTIINNSQMQVGMQTQWSQQVVQTNQPVQQSPTYAMSSSSNQPTTTRAPRQYNQPVTQTSNRGRIAATQQLVNRANSVDSTVISSNDILKVLQETGDDLGSLTPKIIQEKLGQKVNRDLSNKKELWEQVIQIIREARGGTEESITGDINNSYSYSDESTELIAPMRRSGQKRKKSIPFSKSDDENDEDFDPSKNSKKKGHKKKK